LAGRQEDPRPVYDLIEAGLKQQTEIVAAERERDINDDLESALRPYLKAELAEVMNSGGSPEQRRQDIAKLKDVCAKFGLPFNLPREPAPWAAVAALLAGEGDCGIEHVSRLRDSIRFSHRSFNLPDPTSDHIINAILTSIANRKDPAPAL
jgi:hypothetical protein